MTTMQVRKTIEEKRKRLKLYTDRETVMLSPDGVKSYGTGSRNVQRYDTALREVQDMIEKLEHEIMELEEVARGGGRRKAVGVVIRDW